MFKLLNYFRSRASMNKALDEAERDTQKAWEHAGDLDSELERYKNLTNRLQEALNCVKAGKPYLSSPENDRDDCHSAPAKTLPEGWFWVGYDDGSGHLQSPTGKTYFNYDLDTHEYKKPESEGNPWCFFPGYPYDCEGLGWLEEYGERWVMNNVINKESKKQSLKTGPELLNMYEHIHPQHVYAVPFSEELADGSTDKCGDSGSNCSDYDDGYCMFPDDEQTACPHLRKEFYVNQGKDALDFEAVYPGDYIQYLPDGSRKVWRKDEFEKCFRDVTKPLTFVEYSNLCDEPYYHYVPGLPDLCGWVIKEEDDYLDYGCENLSESYGRDYLAFRSKEAAQLYEKTKS